MEGESHRAVLKMEIKSPPDLFFQVVSGKAHMIPTITPGVIPKVEIHEGDWESPLGSVKRWEYMIDGKLESSMEKVVEFDEAKRLISFKVLDGHMFQEHYDSLLATLLVTPLSTEEGAVGSLVEWTLDYVKKHGEAPDAQIYLDVVDQMTKDIDDHLTPAPISIT